MVFVYARSTAIRTFSATLCILPDNAFQHMIYRLFGEKKKRINKFLSQNYQSKPTEIAAHYKCYLLTAHLMFDT